MANVITAVTAANLLKIKQQSALYLPDRPSESKMTPAQIKKAFSDFVTAGTSSALAELGRVITELNVVFAQLPAGIFTTLPTSETTPALSTFTDGDYILLTNGKIYVLTAGAWVEQTLAETTARAAADTTLQNNINAEASTRGNADTALDGKIDDVISGTTPIAAATKATNDSDGNPINTTYLKKVGGTMAGNIAMGTNKITGLGDGTSGSQDASTVKQMEDEVDTDITTHDGNANAHSALRARIAVNEQQIERLDGRGVSYGEIPILTATLVAYDAATRDTAINNAIIALGNTGYTPSNFDIVYDTGIGEGVDWHTWEYNGTTSHWGDAGKMTYGRATETVLGLVKGGNAYVAIDNGDIQVKLADKATTDANGNTIHTYYATKTELNAFMQMNGWTQTALATLSTTQSVTIASLAEYDFITFEAFLDGETDYYDSRMFARSHIITGVNIEFARANADSFANIAVGATNVVFTQAAGSTAYCYVIGVKMALTNADQIPYVNTTSELVADDVQSALDEIDDDLDKVVAGTTPIAYDPTASGLTAVTVKTAIDEVKSRIGTIIQDGKNLKIVACVIRNTGTGWDLVGGAHVPINITSVTNDTSKIIITYSFTATNVISLVCVPDEAMAAHKYFVGASVGLSTTNIYLYQNRSIGGYAYYDGTSWISSADVAPSFSWNAGILTITHPTISGIKASVANRNGEYVNNVGSLGATTTEITFRDYAGALVTTQANNMKVYWQRTSAETSINPNNYVNVDGNIWIYGIFEVE